jgi:hypothetical protein
VRVARGDGGGRPLDACRPLGHTTVQMTMRYVHPAEEDKREASLKFEKYKAAETMKFAARSQWVPTVSTTVGGVN